MSAPEDRRCKVVRKPLRGAVKLLISEPGECNGEMIDISERGAGVITMWPLKTGGRCMIALDIDTYSTRKRINAVGTVVYVNAAGNSRYRAGIEFTDMDAYSRLLIRDLQVPDST